MPFHSARATFGRRLPIGPWSSLQGGQPLGVEGLLRLLLVLLVQALPERVPWPVRVPLEVAMKAKRLELEPLGLMLQNRRLLRGCFRSPLRPIHHIHLLPLQCGGCSRLQRHQHP